MGAPDLAFKLGAPIELSCVISQTADQMQYIFWFRNERMINNDISSEKRGTIFQSKGTNSSSRQDFVSSNLHIFEARPSDSANYTCQPSGASSASVLVHVLEGKRTIVLLGIGLFPFASSQN